MKLFISNIVFFLFLPCYLNAQDLYSDAEKKLADFFTRLDSIVDDKVRLAVNDSICEIISDYAETDSVFSHSFKSLRHLGQVTSPDSLLKIISWNLLLDNYSGKYYSYLIKREKKEGKSRVHFLQASYNSERIDDDTVLNPVKWYGALYYDVRPVVYGNKKRWMVLGLDYGDPLITRKVIEVIGFEEDVGVVFGEKWFETQSGMKYRKVFEYASTGMMTVRFTSPSSIVFDHLVPIAGDPRGNRILYGPDYSYDSYTFENGVWKFKSNVDVRNPR